MVLVVNIGLMCILSYSALELPGEFWSLGLHSQISSDGSPSRAVHLGLMGSEPQEARSTPVHGIYLKA